MIDVSAPRFGLHRSLWVPIAAASVGAIATYVGKVLRNLKDTRKGRVNAVLVKVSPTLTTAGTGIPLWQSSLANVARERLHPNLQVWVHVDYGDYRQAYTQFGMPALPANYFLDHVQNRRAIRLRRFTHPYLRLCPVHRSVNTSGGHRAGGEGMERAFLATHPVGSVPNRIIYADPMDLTKMLDIKPGTQVLDGVRGTQRLFYP